eukprot:1157849-Pelagomonas_calceolata.AAC.2
MSGGGAGRMKGGEECGECYGSAQTQAARGKGGCGELACAQCMHTCRQAREPQHVMDGGVPRLQALHIELAHSTVVVCVWRTNTQSTWHSALPPEIQNCEVQLPCSSQASQPRADTEHQDTEERQEAKQAPTSNPACLCLDFLLFWVAAPVLDTPVVHAH